MATETVTINGITYEVLTASTPGDMDAKGLSNLARHMRETQQTRQLSLRRQKGRGVVYYAIESQHPVFGTYYSDPVSLGRR